MDDDTEDEPFVQEEAEESSDDDDDSSDESDDEEDDDEVEDLIDDAPLNEGQESGGDSGDEEIRRKRKKRMIDDRLEDEDYALIAENTGIQLKRKKFRRVRLEDSDDEEDAPPEAPGDRGGAGREAEKGVSTQSIRDAEDLAHVFGDSDEEDLPESQGSGDKSRRSLEYGDMEDEDDFIVDDFGQPIRRKKDDGTYTDPAMLEAQDIFGQDFDFSELEGLGGDALGSDEEGLAEEDEYGSDVESELGDTATPQRSKKARLRKKKAKTSIYSVYEPSELERGHFTERDAEIRVTDVPERFQVRSIPVQATEEGELDDEAEWIFNELYVKSPISKQPYFMSEKHHSGGTRGSHSGKPQQTTVPKIKEALNFMRNHSFEVPFIANYRREYVEPELDVYDLWKVYQWDEKWMQLQIRKKNMHSLFERMRDYQFEKVRDQPDKALTEDTRVLTDDDILRLDSVMSNEELSDVYAHFSLYYGRDLISMQNIRAEKKNADSSQDGGADDSLDLSLDKDQSGSKKDKGHKVKQAHKRDFYSICQENGLGSLAAKFGLTPEQFGENLRDNYQRHETEQHQDEPETAAKDYVQPGFFSSERAVLQGACHMVAMQIASEPLVRQSLRQVFQSRAVLSARPTKKGRKLIDETHPCCSMKYLRNKPVRELKGDEFLKLVQAEKDHLIEMKISIDLEHSSDKRSASVQSYFEEIRQLFYRDEFSLLVEKWNAQRAQAVAHALLKVLYPLMEKELRNKLLLEAKEHVMQSCIHKFRKWLDSAPIPVKHEDDSLNSSQGPYAKVFACAFTSDRNLPAFCCFVDSNGEVVDFLRLNNLLKRKFSPFEKEREDKEADLETFKTFVGQKHPDLIVVTAESREAMSVVDEFRDCLTELEQEEDLPVVPVEMMDASIARIYSKSRRAKEAFPDYPELLKMAVCLARQMQEPIHEYSALMNSDDDEIFALKIHPLQDTLPKDKLKALLEIELVTKVNDVGVDVHFLMEHPHSSDTLTYVCGLGPRKAAALLKILKQENAQLQNRSQLVTQCSIGPQVFINCAGFIKIDITTFELVDESIYLEILDQTRIHPETYEWARKMAVDALEYDETGDENDPSVAVKEILLTPDKLRDLDLDAFAEELERQEYGNKRTTLYDIRDELFGPYKERRSAFIPLTQEEKFILLTAETPESLYEGKLVTCTVVGIVRRKPMREVLDRAQPIQNERTHLWQCPFCLMDEFRDIGMVWQHIDDGSCPGQSIGVRTRLESGLSGFILTRNLSDKHVNAPEERVHIGMTIHCRILRVNLDKFSVDLTCKSSDLADEEGKFSAPKDIYYDHDASEKDKRKDEAIQKKPQQRYIKRVIVHPSFMNCSFSEAESTLGKMDQGEAIFRPSSKGPDHLTLTWKVDENIHLHIDIKEQDKPNKFSLGKSLLIGDEKYEDLDEILARFVQPMASYARDLITHKSFKAANGGNIDTLKKLLKEDKKKNPQRIPYFFSSSKQYPGKFCLGYQPGSKPRVEYLSITPDGFRYRNKTHSNVNGLLKWFKEHYKDPIPRPSPASITTPSSTSGSQIPSHITQKVDHNLYSQLQAAVNTAHHHHHHQHRGSSGTPYTPTHLAYSTGTPTPQYGQQPPHAFGGGYGAQGGQFGNFQPPQRGGAVGGWGGPPNWSAVGRTPTHTPGRTPAYTPSQTPHSMMSSSYGTPPVVMGRGRHGGMQHRRPGSPIGTPLLDE